MITSNKKIHRKMEYVWSKHPSLWCRKRIIEARFAPDFSCCFITIIAYLVIPAFNTVSATHTIHRGTVITAPTALHKRKRETNQTAGVNFRITKPIKSIWLKDEKMDKTLAQLWFIKKSEFRLGFIISLSKFAPSIQYKVLYKRWICYVRCLARL